MVGKKEETDSAVKEKKEKGTSFINQLICSTDKS